MKGGLVDLKREYINIPNTLSVSRIVLLPLLYLLVLLDMRKTMFVAYIIIASTDYLDGKFARRFDQSSEIGKTLDSIADLLFYISTAFFIYYMFPAVILNNMYLLYVMFSLLGISFVFSWIKLGQPVLMHTSLLRLCAVLVLFLFILTYFMDTTLLIAGLIILYIIGFMEEMMLWGFFGDVDRDTTSFYALWKSKRAEKASK
ncbi:MAG: CDP-alcohol phosphatidyltransferase family protein [Candidatus Thermoplasmatota archaeon]|nr:CDP-alcohol phosphatidyltransferase family protein [Candidatus Thermoplasmatota archaeon]